MMHFKHKILHPSGNRLKARFIVPSIPKIIKYFDIHFSDLNPCPSGWYYSNLRCYKVFLYKGNRYFDRSWGIANEICKANDAYLVTYNSPLEAYAIQQYLHVSMVWLTELSNDVLSWHVKNV